LKKLRSKIAVILLIIVSAVFIFPVFTVLMNSFKNKLYISSEPFALPTPETFAGLSGIGDLIVTCTSMHSRNRRAGILIGQGKSVKEALDEVHMVVEGVYAAESTYKLAKKYNVEMPIVSAAYRVLFEYASPREEVLSLMQREKKKESEIV
jgi:glycerol-3-phosphate dehydrogenase